MNIAFELVYVCGCVCVYMNICTNISVSAAAIKLYKIQCVTSICANMYANMYVYVWVYLNVYLNMAIVLCL